MADRDEFLEIEAYLKDVSPLQRLAVRIKIADYALENPYIIPQIVPYLTDADLAEAQRLAGSAVSP